MQFRRAPPSSRTSTQHIIQRTLQDIRNSQRLIRSIKQTMQGHEMMLRATMTTHKFTVGEAVSFWPDKGQEHTRGELFEIVRLLPETGDAPQYRIKSQTNDHERVVREDQLAPAILA